MGRVPLELPPGIVKTETDTSQEGRYIDGDKVRFVRGRAQKMGGYVKWCYEAFVGACRGLFGWSDSSNNVYVAVGTVCKLYVVQAPPSDDPGTVSNGWGAGGYGEYGWGAGVSEAGTVTGDLVDITPYRDSGSLTDPFTTTYGDATVLVTDTDHGVQIGETVNFSGADPVGEVDMNGAWIVTSVPSVNTFTFEHTAPATFSETGGGSVTYGYEIPCGVTDTSVGTGWGIGGYGQGTWGTPRTSSGFIQFPRFWSLDNYGTNLLAMHNNGSPYIWDPAVGGRAEAIANAPANNFAMFLTDESFLFLLGAGGVPMKVQWPDQDDITLWTPDADNSANSRTLREGSRLVAGSGFGNLVSLVWSDTALYLFAFRGTNYVYEDRVVGRKCGLIGPQAFALADNRAFWMSSTSFHEYSGYVRDIPRNDDINDYVFDALTDAQRSKVVCGYVAEFREVWWLYPSDSATEPSRYVAVNIDDYHWTIGTYARTAFFLLDINDSRPLMAGTDNYIYIHETGTDADGAAMESYIETAPTDIGDGDQSMDLLGFIPNFKDRSGELTIDITAREEPDADADFDTQTETIDVGETVIDLRVSGRAIGLKVTSNVIGGDYRFGKPLVEAEPAGEGRR